jgi:methyl-accepting chemotaxis protein
MASACASTTGRRPSASGSLSRSPDASKRATSRWSTKISDATRSMETAARLTATGAGNRDEAQGALGETTGSVRTVAAAVEKLAVKTDAIGRQVAQSATISTKAVEEAQPTGATVQGLADAARRIGEVVQFTNDIASQTNLQELERRHARHRGDPAASRRRRDHRLAHRR